MKKNILLNTPLFLFLSAIMVLSFNSCEVDEGQDIDRRSYRQVWSDDFDGPAGSRPDSTKWTYDVGTGENGWGNGEFQVYTDDPGNVSLDGEGNLIITARRTGEFSYSSGRIKTEGLFEQTYGRFEARMKTPYGPGIWPAFWLLGNNCDTEIWPQCGEIDVMEMRGQIPQTIAGSLHGPGYSAGSSVNNSFSLENARFDTDYHIFAVEWGEDYVDFFVDDFLYQRVTKDDVPGEWVYDHPFFIILNVAVGGNYVGFPTSETPFPQQMIVDYVRVSVAE